MDNKTVSVIVPVYNTEKYIGKCIRSIISQSCKDLQIIIVDDCSDDQTPDICEKFGKKDNRIELIRNEHRKGVSSARNTGIKNAEGAYICFVDADDTIETDYIEHMRECIEKENVPAVFGKYKYNIDGKIRARKSRIDRGIHTFDEVAGKIIDDGTLTGILLGNVWAAIYNTDFIRQNNVAFDENLRRNEDGVFNIELLQNTDKFYVTEYDGYIYRQWKDSMKPEAFIPDKELEKASDTIKANFGYISNCDIQLCRRAVSIVFWNAIKAGVCKGKIRENSTQLKKYVENTTIKRDYQLLNLRGISKSKRFLIDLLYKRKYRLFCFMMKYVYPLLSKYR